MNLTFAKAVMIRTHVGALRDGVRPNAMELISAPGVGKSSITMQAVIDLARMLNMPVGITVLMLATLSSVDVRGFMVPMQGTEGRALDTMFSTPPWYPTIANTVVVEPNGTIWPEGTWKGKLPDVGIVFLDEWGQAEQEVQKPAAELLLHGRVGTTVLPIGWRVIAASNRMKDRSGVIRPMLFTINRRCEVHVDSDVTAFLSYEETKPKGKRLHHMTMSFASKNPGIVFTDSVPEGTDPFCTPRSLCLMDADLRSLRSDVEIADDRMPMDAIAKEVAAGWIGAGAAAQYFVHLKYDEEIPTIASIVRDPSRAKLPPAKDAQMVCGFMLANHIDEKNASPIMQYLGRMIMEMQVLTMRAAKARPDAAHALTGNQDYNNWMVKNSQLLLAARE